ncbi:MAG: thioredoxin family protein [Myxococcaceae bacterium]|nr:thioredoxin family protein [Myxococcaceae bacterium]
MNRRALALALPVVSVLFACGGSPPKAADVPTEPISGGSDTPADKPESSASSGGDTKTSGGDTKPAAKADPNAKGAPDFSGKSLNGQGTVALASLKGKVVIVDFWATWCEPCKKSFPKLQELYVKYKASGLEIVGISVDDDSKDIAPFGSAHGGAKFPLLWDDGKKIAGKYKPTSMPSSYILDKTGAIRFTHTGYHDGEEATIEDEVKKLLK